MTVAIEGHIRLTVEYERAARQLGVRHIVVDEKNGWDQVYATVEAHLGPQ